MIERYITLDSLSWNLISSWVACILEGKNRSNDKIMSFKIFLQLFIDETMKISTFSLPKDSES